MSDRAERMQAIYDQVPDMDGCKGNCWLSCGPVSMTRWNTGVSPKPPTPSPLTSRHAGRSPTSGARPSAPTDAAWHTSIRPLLCILWGTVDWLPCPWGCRPVGGWLPNETAFRLLLEAEQIGGSGHPVPDEAFEKLRDPAMVAELAAELGRKGGGDRARFLHYGATLPAAITARTRKEADGEGS